MLGRAAYVADEADQTGAGPWSFSGADSVLAEQQLKYYNFPPLCLFLFFGFWESSDI